MIGQRVAITGGTGFLGTHLRARLSAFRPNTEVDVLTRGELDDPQHLTDRLDGVDVVFHLAAVNSHDPTEAAENVALAEHLVASLTPLAAPPAIVYSNTVHARGDSGYGMTKRSAAEALESWSERSSARFSNVMLPNLYGEFGRPNYNSAVATFCEALLTGRTPEVNADGTTSLAHAQQACAALLEAAERGTRDVLVEGDDITVPDLYSRLQRLHEIYHGTHHIPELADALDLGLLNQLRAAAFPRYVPRDLTHHRDARGAFFEAVRCFGASQTSLSTTNPGIRRGDHWHLSKIERFLVLSGQARIEVRRLFSDEVYSFDVNGSRPQFIDMPPLFTHSIENTGESDLLTLFWANDHFNPDNPDTFPELVSTRATTTTSEVNR